VAVLTNHLAASVSDASAHLSFLLLATFLTSFAAPGASFLAVLGLAVRGRKPGARQRLQGSVWWIAVFVLAAFAVAFYLRNAALHQIAITGRP
ncbi:MAG TPA: hypothetical protein VMM92_02325, partial [Thermoanaerobaculia bacterium]|nr:hypothetical protein [Thermoanaerobaculia bacterium]